MPDLSPTGLRSALGAAALAGLVEERAIQFLLSQISQVDSRPGNSPSAKASSPPSVPPSISTMGANPSFQKKQATHR
jgi:hypothetical protein